MYVTHAPKAQHMPYIDWCS